MAGNNSHGLVEFFCVDYWDPLCKECAKGHNPFSRVTKNHAVKVMSEIDQSDVELHNRQRALLCSQHKDKAFEFYCTNCNQFSCHSCNVFIHNTHKLISVQEADSKFCTQLDAAEKSAQESINIAKEEIKMVTLSNEALETSETKLLEAEKALLDDVKRRIWKNIK